MDNAWACQHRVCRHSRRDEIKKRSDWRNNAWFDGIFWEGDNRNELANISMDIGDIGGRYADSPNIVTLSGSSPNSAMFSPTHCNANRWSYSPKFLRPLNHHRLEIPSIQLDSWMKLRWLAGLRSSRHSQTTTNCTIMTHLLKSLHRRSSRYWEICSIIRTGYV